MVPGIPHAEILRLARKKNADLIVMGCSTEDDLQRRSRMWGIAGSNIERVSQKARCPVMIVAREVPEGRMQFASIVVATDFSFQAECAVGYGGQLARQYGAALHVFHALDVGHGMEAPDQRQIETGIAEARQRMLKEFAPRLEGIREVSYESWEGVPSMEILKYARMRGADLILMAHHSQEKDPRSLPRLHGGPGGPERELPDHEHQPPLRPALRHVLRPVRRRRAAGAGRRTDHGLARRPGGTRRPRAATARRGALPRLRRLQAPKSLPWIQRPKPPRPRPRRP